MAHPEAVAAVRLPCRRSGCPGWRTAAALACAQSFCAALAPRPAPHHPRLGACPQTQEEKAALQQKLESLRVMVAQVGRRRQSPLAAARRAGLPRAAAYGSQALPSRPRRPRRGGCMHTERHRVHHSPSLHCCTLPLPLVPQLEDFDPEWEGREKGECERLNQVGWRALAVGQDVGALRGRQCCSRRRRMACYAISSTAWGVAEVGCAPHRAAPARALPARAPAFTLRPCLWLSPTHPPSLPCPARQQEIAELTVQKERLQRGADALEKRRGALLAQIAGLKEASGRAGGTPGGAGGEAQQGVAAYSLSGGRRMCRGQRMPPAAPGEPDGSGLGSSVRMPRRLHAPSQAGGAVEGELASLQEQVDKVAAEVRQSLQLFARCHCTHRRHAAGWGPSNHACGAGTPA